MLDTKCAFNQIYKFDAEHVIEGVSVGETRRELAIELASHISGLGNRYDVVSGIPNTGYFYAEQVAESLGSKFSRIFEKRRHKRTLGNAVHERISIYDSLLISLDSIRTNDSVLFVDEALLSGLTLQVISDACREIGLTRYTFAFVSPVTLCHCPWGHIKHTDRWFHDLNWSPTPAHAADLRQKLLEETGAEDIIHCPPQVFSRVIDASRNCTLCFQEDLRDGRSGTPVAGRS